MPESKGSEKSVCLIHTRILLNNVERWIGIWSQVEILIKILVCERKILRSEKYHGFSDS